MMIIKIIVTLCFCTVLAVSADKATDSLFTSCSINYLKSAKKLDESFIDEANFGPELCEKLINVTKEFAEEAYRAKLKGEEQQECLVGEFMRANLFEYSIRRDALKKISQLSDVVRAEMVQSESNEIDRIFRAAAVNCGKTTPYSDRVKDSIISQNEVQEYCKRKYAVDHGLVDIENFPMNPKNIDTENFNCEAFMHFLHEVFVIILSQKLEKQHLKESEIECIMTETVTSRTYFVATAAEVLKTIEASEEDKTRNERNLFNKLDAFKKAIDACEGVGG